MERIARRERAKPAKRLAQILHSSFFILHSSFFILHSSFFISYSPSMRNLLLLSILILASCSPQLPTAAPVSAQYEMPKQAFSRKGMVVTAHPVATQVGVEILEKGGNAVDAMVAVHFALAVVYQRAGNIGGGGFMLYREAASGKTVSLDFRETAPQAASRNMYLDSLGKAIDSLSRDGHLAVGTPGSVDGMWQAHQKYGKLAWADLIAPAEKLARQGVLLTNYEARTLNEMKPIFEKVNRYRPAIVRDSVWKKGDTLIQTDLANTMLLIQQNGREGFYSGAVADLLVAEMQAKNGLITHKDLADYKAIWREPIAFDFNGYRIYSMAPPSSGGILLAQLFGMIQHYPLRKMGFHSVEAIHLMVEAERRAYADRAQHLGDPDFYPVPTKKLIEPEYNKKRIQADFNPNKASKSADIKGGQWAESEETTHYCITDSMGNAISVTTTVNTNYGSKVLVMGGGFILNNEMDDFSAKPNSPNVFGLVGGEANAIAPKKRMLSCMSPTIVEKKDKLFMLVGTPGGATIPTSVFQVLVNVLVFEQPLLKAVHNKRFHHQHLPDKIQPEKDAFSKQTLKKLRAIGHIVEERKSIGLVEAILIHPDGRHEGVADRRSTDTAIGVK
jgi:gamma-glutamyltranspeptidase / glutathione hydrolase